MEEGKKLKRALGVPVLIMFGLAYMVPLAVFTTYGIATEITRGYLPAAYVITLAAMLVTAYSYANMVKEVPAAGSSYSYVKHTFGRTTGFMVGWSLLLDYLLLPLMNYLLIGLYLHAQFPAVAPWIWILGALVVIVSLNVIGMMMVSWANFLLIAAQVAFLLTFFFLSYGNVSDRPHVDFLAPLYGADFAMGSIVAGSAILCLTFLGFEAISTLSEEAKNPQKNIPRAIMGCTFVGGILFIITSYVCHLVYPSHQFSNPDSAGLDIFAMLGGKFLTSFFTAAYVAGCFASGLASQASVSRVLFAMGRDRVLPYVPFGILHNRFNTPYLNIIIVGIISLAAVFASLEFIASMISFGALVAFSFVNLTVIKHYLIDKKMRGAKACLIYGFFPVLGFLLCLWLWTSLSGHSIMFGTGWAAIGYCLIWAAKKRKGGKITEASFS